MSATAYSPGGPSHRSQTGMGPVAWTIMGVLAMGAAHAVEGIVQIGREILGPDSTRPDGGALARPPATREPHHMAGFFLIMGAAYIAKLARRAIADLKGVAREIGVARS